MDLLAPVQLGRLALRNRLALAPLTNCQSNADGTLHQREIDFLAMRARGGFALIETCAAFVAQDGKGWAGSIGVHDDACLPGLTTLAQAVHDAGAMATVQLFHGGARAPADVTGSEPWSASEFDAKGFFPHRAGGEADIVRITDAFIDGAKRCQRAGFDGVEIHGAHGYLLTQFLSTAYNKRSDQWGGDLAGRARLLRTIARGIRQATGPAFSVAVRLSPENWTTVQGLDLDESIQVAQWLNEDGADIIHLSLWTGRDLSAKRPGQHTVSIFRKALPANVGIVAAGGVWTVEDAQFLVDQGATAVAIGRAAILNPAWPNVVAARGEAPTRPPYPRSKIADIAVSEVFADYLGRFPGLLDAAT
ncbi:MAG: NADH:flavin oxidoreductase [Myxococcales bacterium]|nr:NADH:flavin oxidoreductase [Myxococcales bacterium]